MIDRRTFIGSCAAGAIGAVVPKVEALPGSPQLKSDIDIDGNLLLALHDDRFIVQGMVPANVYGMGAGQAVRDEIDRMLASWKFHRERQC